MKRFLCCLFMLIAAAPLYALETADTKTVVDTGSAYEERYYGVQDRYFGEFSSSSGTKPIAAWQEFTGQNPDDAERISWVQAQLTAEAQPPENEYAVKRTVYSERPSTAATY